MKKAMVLVAMVAGALLSAVPAHAECSVESGKIDFPAYDVYGTTPIDGVGELRYMCSPDQKDVTPTIRIVFGPATDGTFTRVMSHGSEKLKYNVYLDPSRTAIWGDGSAGTMTYVAACCAVGKFAVLSMYGRIPAGQDVEAGNYVDSLLMNLEF